VIEVDYYFFFWSSGLVQFFTNIPTSDSGTTITVWTVLAYIYLILENLNNLITFLILRCGVTIASYYYLISFCLWFWIQEKAKEINLLVPCPWLMGQS